MKASFGLGNISGDTKYPTIAASKTVLPWSGGLMPFTVKDIIEGRRKPVTVPPDATVKLAIERMIEHDFSQLPVVRDDKPLGMVTSDSILRALESFDVKVDALRVSDALVYGRAFREDDDLFILMNDLRENYAVLIVDGEGKLIGIVTSYDATEYFRRNSEDMMLVEDIESTLKYYIRTALGVEEEEADSLAVREAIQEITPSKDELRKNYEKALRYFLNSYGIGTPKNIQAEWVDETFSKHFASRTRPKKFGDLTFGEYTDLFLHKSRWELYSSVFSLDRSAVRNLLDEVRTIRNNLAHFRGELSARQRNTLRFCADWLSYHQQAMEAVFVAGEARAEESSTVTDVATDPDPADKHLPIQETADPRESRYALLAVFLQGQPADRDDLQLSFEQVERLIGDQLPDFAYRHRSWWANDPLGPVQSREWINAGWRTSRVNISEGTVTFSRIKEHREGYIRFFDSLLAELRANAQWPVRKGAPDGRSWCVVAELPGAGTTPPVLAFTFSQRGKFRAELYIGAGDAESNRRTFNSLYAKKQQIEAQVGKPLSWERLDNGRAWRIALYEDGSITDDQAKLARLRAWGVESMLRLREALAESIADTS